MLDVGAGIGRHALAYARTGFDVLAIDPSPTGLHELVRSAQAEGLCIDTRIAPFAALPIKSAEVDHVLAWNVLYHGDGHVVTAALEECRRVLRPGGTLQLTMLSKRNSAYGHGHEMRPDTFVDDTSAGDKDHPHFYVDAAGLADLLAGAGFEAMSIVDVDQHPPGGWHWVLLAEMVPPRPS